MSPKLKRILIEHELLETKTKKELDQLTKEKQNQLIMIGQGTPVKITDNENLPLTLQLFYFYKKLSPEVIFQTAKKENFIIFSNYESSPDKYELDRLEEIQNLELSKFKLDKIKNKDFQKTLTIDFKGLPCPKNISQKNLNKFLTELSKETQPAQIVTLTGQKPLFYYLLTVHLLTPICAEIWYQKNTKTKNIKIYEY